jgi:Kef-type K+ transport system membrane component KefB
MNHVAVTLTTIGALLLLGLVADALASRTPLPRVTVLMLLGLLAGPAAFDGLPPDSAAWFTVVANTALAMIGFLLGGEFTRSHWKVLERVVFRVALAESATTATLVGLGLWAIGTSPEVALSLAGIAAATAPAATLAVVRETGAHGSFANVLKGVVAVDDVMGIVLFSILVTGAALLVDGSLQTGAMLGAVREIGGSIGLGLALGLPAAQLTGRIRAGEATLEEALGLVLLCAGLAMYLGLSPILAAIVMGATIANMARHHHRPFHEIESIEWPVLVVFFLLAGASLEVEGIGPEAGLAAAYVLFRAVGKALGPIVAGRAGGMEPAMRGWLGLALLPQAGVALGLALAARLRFPDTGTTVLNVVVMGTVVFELVGPAFTRLALHRAGSVDGGETLDVAPDPFP